MQRPLSSRRTHATASEQKSLARVMRKTGDRARLALVCLSLLLAALEGTGSKPSAAGGEAAILDLAPVVFEELGAASGVDFVLRNSATPRKYQIEPMIAGVALFDYDNDGYLDIYLVNGAEIPALEKTGPRYFNRLYRNQGNGTFRDVTLAAGVQGKGYSMAAGAADYDNDGWQDLYVAGVNRNSLYRNNGDGTFSDVTARAGVAGIHPRFGKTWAVAAGWFDYDNDGWLDLFVANYVAWGFDKDPFCGWEHTRVRIYCHPSYFEPLPNFLFRNHGNGTFSDVSAESGIGRHLGKGMGVAFADYDDDGDLDVFVANDKARSLLFRNDGKGVFSEQGIRAGVAYNGDGRMLSCMGVDFRDIDNDGRPDLFITALTNETFPYYHNEGGGIFDDFTRRSELARLSITMSGWSNGIYDLNNDGWKDLFSVNSYIEDIDHIITNYPYRQRNAVFANRGGRFVDLPAAPGPASRRRAPTAAAPSEIWTTTGGSTSWPPASTSRRESFATFRQGSNTGCWWSWRAPGATGTGSGPSWSWSRPAVFSTIT